MPKYYGRLWPPNFSAFPRKRHEELCPTFAFARNPVVGSAVTLELRADAGQLPFRSVDSEGNRVSGAERHARADRKCSQ